MVPWPMQRNSYNLISVQNEIYEESAKLNITPEPDRLRVFMAWKSVDKPVEIAAQTVELFVYKGFTVVEWGGCRVES